MSQTPPLRILMLTCMFLPEVYGGAEQQCLRQSQALVRRGHQVTILTARTKKDTPRHERMGEVDVIRHDTFLPPDLLGRYLPFSLLWLGHLTLFGLLNRGKFDIVQCHQGKFGLFAGAVLSKLLGVPQIIKIGNSGFDLDVKTLGKKKVVGPIFLKLGLKNRPHFVPISAQIDRELREFGIADDQLTSIVNGVVPLDVAHVPFEPELARFFLAWEAGGHQEPAADAGGFCAGFEGAPGD